MSCKNQFAMVKEIWWSGIVLGSLSFSHAQPEAASKEERSTASISWSDDVSTPAVCLGRNQWFVSVIPEGVEKGISDPVSVFVGDDKFSAEILFLNQALRLCLIEGSDGLPKFRSHPLADLVAPEPGTNLHCHTHESQCRTTVAGKDYYYLGKPLPVPLLRVRIAETEKFCHPGTPLVNSSGELEGILMNRVRGAHDQAHAIPVAQIRKMVHEFERYQHSGKVWVGMVFHRLSTTPEVLEVRKDSPANKAGVVSGDVILKLNKQEVKNVAELAEVIRNLPAGEKTPITVLRGLEQVQMALVPEFSEKKPQ